MATIRDKLGQHQGRAEDSRTFTPEHDSRSVPARRLACDGNCAGGGEVQREQTTRPQSWPSAKAAHCVFDYDDKTIPELERTITQASAGEQDRHALAALFKRDNVFYLV
jgi:hypothetical protein